MNEPNSTYKNGEYLVSWPQSEGDVTIKEALTFLTKLHIVIAAVFVTEYKTSMHTAFENMKTKLLDDTSWVE